MGPDGTGQSRINPFQGFGNLEMTWFSGIVGCPNNDMDIARTQNSLYICTEINQNNTNIFLR
ncbi:hypothetical protein T11_15340 [Trichinella zimbabwensis]|uniref:Uncharacterized protein n=1 Tax=Trichinella zimbabwensis TaxID=268475 RepID=A0A0V1HLC8_9BILA|nr:hypothetical protein T11_15340 [Trichinella zimbabwensis]